MTGATYPNRGPQKRGKWRRTAFPILTVALAVLLTLAVAELILRLSGVRSAILHSDMFLTTDDRLLPYILRPGYVGDYAGGRVTIDEDGNRVVKGPLPKGGEGTIVLLGDSVVFGQGLDDEDTIATTLARMLADKKRPFRVEPIGAAGYTAWNEYARLSRVKDWTKARGVILIYVRNDVTKDDDALKYTDLKAADFFHRVTGALYDHSRLAFLLGDVARRLRANASGAAPADATLTIDRDALAYSMMAVAKIKELCEAHGVPVVVGIYRDATAYALPQQTAEYEAAVSQALVKIPVESFVVARHIEGLPLERSQLSWADLLHPSAEASRIIARQLFEEVDRRGWLNSPPSN